MKTCFRIHESDNVATLLADTAEEQVEIIGAALDHPVVCREPIAFGHKIAVIDIAANSGVMKYGIVIGIASQEIRAGQWVHLHNCRSQLDERSSTLDLHTGSSQDVAYE